MRAAGGVPAGSGAGAAGFGQSRRPPAGDRSRDRLLSSRPDRILPRHSPTRYGNRMPPAEHRSRRAGGYGFHPRLLGSQGCRGPGVRHPDRLPIRRCRSPGGRAPSLRGARGRRPPGRAFQRQRERHGPSLTPQPSPCSEGVGSVISFLSRRCYGRPSICTIWPCAEHIGVRSVGRRPFSTPLH